MNPRPRKFLNAYCTERSERPHSHAIVSTAGNAYLPPSWAQSASLRRTILSTMRSGNGQTFLLTRTLTTRLPGRQQDVHWHPAVGAPISGYELRARSACEGFRFGAAARTQWNDSGRGTTQADVGSQFVRREELGEIVVRNGSVQHGSVSPISEYEYIFQPCIVVRQIPIRLIQRSVGVIVAGAFLLSEPTATRPRPSSRRTGSGKKRPMKSYCTSVRSRG
jgi:hypothetical protein